VSNAAINAIVTAVNVLLHGEYRLIKLPGRSYDLYDSPPLPVIDLVPLLGSQHQAATGCYNKYVELIKEQHKSWPTLTA
jgi:hypothetical protein